MIEVEGLSKRYGDKIAVNDLSFVVRPGKVTGFLGPNGAGKSTTMRMIVGLDSPTSGEVRVAGGRYVDLPAPLTTLGALLEAKSIHPGRSAANHLLALARTHGIGRRRVDEVIDQVGLREVAGKRAGGFSLGMGQRLGIATALLGDPSIVMLDEPVNGLDPDGVLWIRNLLRGLAKEGRTVFLSSHLMSEMALTADQLIVIGRGRLLASSSVQDFIDEASEQRVRVVTDEAGLLASLLAAPGVAVSSETSGELLVSGLDNKAIGRLASTHSITLFELTPQTASLEQAYMEMTKDSVDYEGTVGTATALVTPELEAAGVKR
ncbi:ATP-binding cassette domain-containing protein [Nocardia sp. NPDC003183]